MGNVCIYSLFDGEPITEIGYLKESAQQSYTDVKHASVFVRPSCKEYRKPCMEWQSLIFH